MSRPNRLFFAAFLALVEFHATSANSAPANSAFLSHTGSGTTCSQALPCNNMATALTVAGTGGEVICLDKGNYSGASITQSVTISCGYGFWEAPGVTVFINTPAGADVVIEGLVSDGMGATNIMTFTGQGSLHLRQVRLGHVPANGLHVFSFVPSGPATLHVSNSVFYSNGGDGGSAICAGIYIRPASGVTADVSIERSQIDRNSFGIIADGTAGGVIRGIVSDSFVINNVRNGITVATSGSSTVLTVDNTKITGNAFGLVASGANAGMLIRRSIISGNATGLFPVGSGVLLSYRDNSLNANTTTDGAFNGFVNTQ